MRRLIGIVLVSSLILGLVASTSFAEPKPTNVPHQVQPGEEGFTAAFGGAAFADLWEELDGVGAELPQTAVTPVTVPGTTTPLPGLFEVKDDLVRGPVPIGFTFHYMNGPVEPAPGWPPADWQEWWTGDTAPPYPEDWPSELTDAGYAEAYVSTNGFIVFRDRSFSEGDEAVRANTVLPVAQQPDLGAWNWWPWQVPIAEPPNNFVAPYWTDLAIGDNSYQKVSEVCKQLRPCSRPPPVGIAGEINLDLVECYEWVPCEWETVTRPRGRLLYATLGTAPNRKFVVEWLNARNHWTGFLTTFQLQLFEGSNAVLFLYKDFQVKDEGQAYFDVPSVLIGMEDWYGTTGVGQAYTVEGARTLWNEGGISWRVLMEIEPKWISDYIGLLPTDETVRIPAPMANGDMVGFVN